MKYIIDISEDDFSDISEGGFLDSEQRNRIVNAILKATPCKKGHWIDEEDRESLYTCSVCREKSLGRFHPFCPWCGAMMEVEYRR